MNGRQDLSWSPRVPKAKIRQLYQSDARGTLDLDLLEEVGFTLLQRCQDILTIHQAKKGVVKCPRCDRQNQNTLIQRHFKPASDPRHEPIRCPSCGWQITWGEYSLSFKRRQLNPGGAVEVFQNYVQDYQAAVNASQKMLAVDRLIHEFHRSLIHPTGRPVCVNLIQGSLSDIVPFLDHLSYAGHLPARLQQQRQAWREEMGTTHWSQLIHQEGNEYGKTSPGTGHRSS